MGMADAAPATRGTQQANVAERREPAAHRHLEVPRISNLPLGLPYTLSRSPLRRLAPFAWARIASLALVYFGWLASLRSLAVRSSKVARTAPAPSPLQKMPSSLTPIRRQMISFDGAAHVSATSATELVPLKQK